MKGALIIGIGTTFAGEADMFSPGGTERPGGGPFADGKAPGLIAAIELILKGPVVLMGVDGLLLPGCPARTPNGFLEKLSRIPPLTLLCN
jgi:hypothetical protein